MRNNINGGPHCNDVRGHENNPLFCSSFLSLINDHFPNANRQKDTIKREAERERECAGGMVREGCEERTFWPTEMNTQTQHTWSIQNFVKWHVRNEPFYPECAKSWGVPSNGDPLDIAREVMCTKWKERCGENNMLDIRIQNSIAVFHQASLLCCCFLTSPDRVRAAVCEFIGDIWKVTTGRTF